MIKIIFNTIAVGILVGTFLYLSISFVHLDLNPGKWSEGSRFLFVSVIISLMMGTGIFTYLELGEGFKK